MTRSLYRVDHQVGFKNYVYGSMLDYIILGYLIDIRTKKAKSEL
jgi:transposase